MTKSCNTSVLSDGLAEEIADDLLYRSGQAMISGDFESFRACFDVPQVYETATGKRIAKTEAEFRQVYDDVRAYHETNHIIDRARMVISASFISPDTIGSTHVSSLMQEGGTNFRKPHPAYSIIRKFDEEWRIVSCIYAILDDPELIEALTTK